VRCVSTCIHVARRFERKKRSEALVVVSEALRYLDTLVVRFVGIAIGQACQIKSA